MAAVVTQNNLARMMDLTQSTVSRALRGSAGISTDLRRRVLEAAREIGYKLPNGVPFDESAFEKKGNVCVDIPSVDEWHRRLIDGVVAAAAEAGDEVMVCPHTRGDLPRVVTNRQVDGLIRLMSQSDYARGKTVPAAPVPTVSVLYPVPGADVVSVDHFGSSRALALRMSEQSEPVCAAYLGHNRPIGQARYYGFRSGLEQWGVSFPRELVRMTDTLDETMAMPLVEELLDLRAVGGRDRQFTLIGFYNDYLARHAIEAIRARGLRVPEDIGVVGYDDVAPPLVPDIRLTTVHLPLAEMGAAAVRRLHWRLNNPDGEPPLHWLIETRVVEGNSVRGR